MKSASTVFIPHNRWRDRILTHPKRFSCVKIIHLNPVLNQVVKNSISHAYTSYAGKTMRGLCRSSKI